MEPENDYPLISPWALVERLFKSQPTQILTYDIVEYIDQVELETSVPMSFKKVSPISYMVFLNVI